MNLHIVATQGIGLLLLLIGCLLAVLEVFKGKDTIVPSTVAILGWFVCLFVYIVMLFGMNNAKADEFLIANVAAHHWNNDAKFNQKNYGLGIENVFDCYGCDGDLMGEIGFYKNSLNAQSGYALLGYTPLHLGVLRVGVIGGAVTGYPLMPVVPAAGVLVSLRYEKVLANIIMTPNVEKYGVNGFAGLQVGYQF